MPAQPSNPPNLPPGAPETALDDIEELQKLASAAACAAQKESKGAWDEKEWEEEHHQLGNIAEANHATGELNTAFHHAPEDLSRLDGKLSSLNPDNLYPDSGDAIAAQKAISSVPEVGALRAVIAAQKDRAASISPALEAAAAAKADQANSAIDQSAIHIDSRHAGNEAATQAKTSRETSDTLRINAEYSIADASAKLSQAKTLISSRTAVPEYDGAIHGKFGLELAATSMYGTDAANHAIEYTNRYLVSETPDHLNDTLSEHLAQHTDGIYGLYDSEMAHALSAAKDKVNKVLGITALQLAENSFGASTYVTAYNFTVAAYSHRNQLADAENRAIKQFIDNIRKNLHNRV